ncbi:MarR family winged helix-turn-helix transcriptional regulator [Nocardia veterana]|uniref:MarR family transcriptional regulator n=1 Tax=Nocardia veterana TaxID=132249 RepID=A0A7X6LWF0_9NOCA|nr:MarR family transcriptional regulator [Nocardia veterana]NKY85381.1 MarR family transcriptional regulator [Nocardia veterana]
MGDDVTAVEAIERAMVAIRRSQTRRTLNRLAAKDARTPIDPTTFDVLDAVEGRADTATVGDIAQALGIDQPRASRLVARAVADGLLYRQADQGDGRRVILRLTSGARAALARAHEARQAVFARTTADWTAAERNEFARLLTKFVEDFDRAVSGTD